MVIDSIHVFERVWRMDWRGLRMEVALVRDNTGWAQGGGTGGKEKLLDLR